MSLKGGELNRRRNTCNIVTLGEQTNEQGTYLTEKIMADRTGLFGASGASPEARFARVNLFQTNLSNRSNPVYTVTIHMIYTNWI